MSGLQGWNGIIAAAHEMAFGASVLADLATVAAVWLAWRELHSWKRVAATRETHDAAKAALLASRALTATIRDYRQMRFFAEVPMDPRAPEIRLTDFEVTYHEESRWQGRLEACLHELRVAGTQLGIIVGPEEAGALAKLGELGARLRSSSLDYVMLMAAKHRGRALPEDRLQANTRLRIANRTAEQPDAFGDQVEAAEQAVEQMLRPLLLSSGR